MTQAQKIDANGKAVGQVELNDLVFGVEPNLHAMHLAVLRELANARAGSANSKTRSEVRGGGRKPWKQKGTGRARAGSIRSPLWRGGGVIFGPQPRDFSMNLPKKVRKVALKSGLSVAAAKTHVVEDFSFLELPKTKLLASFLKTLNADAKKVLILADWRQAENKNLLLASRNLPGVKLSLDSNLSVKDLVEADVVILTQAAIQQIEARYVA